MKKEIEGSSLGKKTPYLDKYHPQLLYPISRVTQEEIFGYDLWNLYEISWLNHYGKAEVAIGQAIYEAHSPKIVESKSFKLYLNSLNNSKFSSREEVTEVIARDLSRLVEIPVKVALIPLTSAMTLVQSDGLFLDHLEPSEEDWIESEEEVSERLFSNLFRSNCPITEQPDWASLVIDYSGRKISHKRLLSYLLSFRNHRDFHENAIEKLLRGIMKFAQPHTLSISGHYTRRGGLDINPFRSNRPSSHPSLPILTRFIRQ